MWVAGGILSEFYSQFLSYFFLNRDVAAPLSPFPGGQVSSPVSKPSISPPGKPHIHTVEVCYLISHLEPLSFFLVHVTVMYDTKSND